MIQSQSYKFSDIMQLAKEKIMTIDSLQELYSVTKTKLEGRTGQITINFAGRTHVYTGNDVIGNCLQEWLPNWFAFLGVTIEPGEGTQVFPDFVAQFGTNRYDIEVKAWNINNAPAFDLANFHSFIESTYEHPEKINARYFILGYKPLTDGFSQGFTVEKVFLKQIWQITSPSRKYPINLQVKRDNPYAIRPCNFNHHTSKTFTSKLDFLKAIRDAFILFPNTVIPCTPDEWFDKVSRY